MAILLTSALTWSADMIEMQNGDRYAGKVLSLDTNTLVLKSDVLGTVRLKRSQVASVHLGEVSATTRTNSSSQQPELSVSSSKSLTNAVPDMSESLRQLGSNSNLASQVQAQFLGGAGPEANRKFQELLGGLSSGKLTISDLRGEAKSAADQLRTLRRELGEDSAGALDGYLAILDNFLQETAPATATRTNSPARSTN